MVSARVRVRQHDGLNDETGQRVVVVDRDGTVNVMVDRAALAEDPEGVLEVLSRHLAALFAPRGEEPGSAVG